MVAVAWPHVIHWGMGGFWVAVERDGTMTFGKANAFGFKGFVPAAIKASLHRAATQWYESVAHCIM